MAYVRYDKTPEVRLQYKNQLTRKAVQISSQSKTAQSIEEDGTFLVVTYILINKQPASDSLAGLLVKQVCSLTPCTQFDLLAGR